jgi:hypothetical protein
MTVDSAALRARPTIYNGIPMRSRLEARVAAWLDSLGVRWQYEPNAFADATRQYLPDFELVGSPYHERHGIRAFLEVKGALDYDSYSAEQERMKTILGSCPRALLMLADESMLEIGRVEVYNHLISRYLEHSFVCVLVSTELLPMPATWSMPAWGAQ